MSLAIQIGFALQPHEMTEYDFALAVQYLMDLLC